jgi:hypothetical protein
VSTPIRVVCWLRKPVENSLLEHFHIKTDTLCFSLKGGILLEANTHLDNSINATLPNVRLNAPGTPQVTLIFPATSDPNAKGDIASMLLAAFTKMQGSEKHEKESRMFV